MVYQPILIVEDAEVTRRVLVGYLASAGFRSVTAVDGVEAWEILQQDPEGFEAVLLDRMMPRMSGLELLRKMKAQPALDGIPVILQTALGSPADILEGLEQGAFYYLTKPLQKRALLAIVKTAVADHARYRELREEVCAMQGALAHLVHGTFECRTVVEGMRLASLLAKPCPQPERVVIGLSELVINAIEHGNLGITYEEKSQLNESGDWNAEVDRRLALPENVDKRVTVECEISCEQIRFSIRDEGDGFDWQGYLAVDPARVFDNHGRGIAMAKMTSFDQLEFRGAGNVVEATVHLEAALQGAS